MLIRAKCPKWLLTPCLFGFRPCGLNPHIRHRRIHKRHHMCLPEQARRHNAFFGWLLTPCLFGFRPCGLNPHIRRRRIQQHETMPIGEQAPSDGFLRHAYSDFALAGSILIYGVAVYSTSIICAPVSKLVGWLLRPCLFGFRPSGSILIYGVAVYSNTKLCLSVSKLPIGNFRVTVHGLCCAYILAGASKPKMSIDFSKVFFVTVRRFIKPACFFSSASAIILLSW